MFEERTTSAGPVFPAGLPVAEVADSDLPAALRECEAAKAAWDARKLELVADTHRRAADWMLPSATDVSPAVDQMEVAGQEEATCLALTLNSGCNLVHLALTLAQRLPAVAAALRVGGLDLPRARLIVELTGSLPQPAARTVAEAALAYAPGRTYGQLRQKLRRLVIRADPTTAEQRRTEAAAERSLRLLPAEDGMADLWLHAPAEQALATYTTVNHAAHRLRSAGDPRGLDALRADLLTNLVLAGSSGVIGRPADHAADIGRSPGAGRGGSGDTSDTRQDPGRGIRTGGPPDAGRVLVRITGTAGALLGRDETAAELDGYGAVSAGVLRELAYRVGAVWQPLVADPQQIRVRQPNRYVPPPRLAAAIRVADGTCRWPGCGQPAWRCDLDHVIPHADGGQTKATNMAALCRRHHRLKTHTKWTVRLDEHRQLHVTSPLGQTAVTSPRHPPPAHPHP